MNRRQVVAVGIGLAVASVVEGGSVETLAQESSSSFTEGELLKATRSFQVAETRLTGTLVYQFVVSHIDTEANARRALGDTLDNVRTGSNFTEFMETSGPDIGEDTIAFTASLENEGTTFETGSFLFRIGTNVFLWSAIGLAAPTISDLSTVADGFYGGETTGTPVAEIDEERILGLLPGLDDLPPGFALEEELVELGDAVATPTP